MIAASFPLATSVPVGPHWDGQPATDLFAPEGTSVLAIFDGSAYARDSLLGATW